jgi:hypothetical protein
VTQGPAVPCQLFATHVLVDIIRVYNGNRLALDTRTLEDQLLFAGIPLCHVKRQGDCIAGTGAQHQGGENESEYTQA